MDPAGLPIAQELISKAAQQEVPQVPQVPKVEQVQQFDQMMQQQGNYQQANDTRVHVVHQEYLSRGIDKPFVSIGDTILSRLQGMGDDYQARIDQLRQLSDKPIKTPEDAYKLFMEISQISLQQQLALSVTSKVNKNAESLLKAQ